MHDVIVIGGGVIGLSIARELRRDRSVLLLERGKTGEGTSAAAAGMLSPQSEADAPGPFFDLSMSSLRMYRQFAAELHDESGVDPEYEDRGLLFLASTDAEFEELGQRARWQRQAGYPVEDLSPGDVRRLEPSVTLDAAGAIFIPGDHQVVPRKLVHALNVSCVRRKVDIRTDAHVEAVLSEHGRVTGVRTSAETIHASTVIVASGVWSSTLQGLLPPIPVFPRKGQILSLTMKPETFRHIVRWRKAYFVPRKGGELVVGATNENAGFDRSLTASAIAQLLTDAQRISSQAGNFAIKELWTGLRPATPDEYPILGASSIEGLIYATGHYRNGILLAPVTASIIANVVNRKEVSPAARTFGSQRFNV